MKTKSIYDINIVTHDKTAHLDDFLACCVVLAKCNYDGLVPKVLRQSHPSEEQLDDPNAFVIDFGRRHEPENKNFDHHQITGGKVCAFTQVLEYYGMRNYKSLPWISFVETFDHCGPVAAMKSINSTASIDDISNPIQDYMIQIFSSRSTVEHGDYLYGVMIGIGYSIIANHDKYEKTLEILNNASNISVYNEYKVIDYTVFNKDEFEQLSVLAMKHYENDNSVDIIYNRDYRNSVDNFRLVRKGELNFLNAKNCEGVYFVHQSGFLIGFTGDYRKIIDAM